MSKIIRIGTRNSPLAVWQAKYVQNILQAKKIKTTLVLVKSEGDLDLKTPLYEMGVQGVFTKTLDIALLNNRVDIAVHSLKDVPTQLPYNISIAAIPERASSKDTLVIQQNSDKQDRNLPTIIATSSLRRKAQWLHRHPNHLVESIRGNVNTRLETLANTPKWSGAIFAAAGLNRLELKNIQVETLNWMLPAPAQGALGIVCRTDDLATLNICQTLDHPHSNITSTTERMFLRAMQGGCSMPIGAYASIQKSQLIIEGNILSLDGQEKATATINVKVSEAAKAGQILADKLLAKGGQAILEKIQKNEAIK